MQMLNFSSETITFPFVANNHLKTTLILANDTTNHIYYKFRASKSRPFLVKPNQGHLDPRGSVSVSFTLSKDQINNVVGDKFLLMYIGSETPKPQNYSQIFVGDYEVKKFPINITGIELSSPKINDVVAQVGEQIFTSVNKDSNKKQVFSTPVQSIKNSARKDPEKVGRQNLQRQIGQFRKQMDFIAKESGKATNKTPISLMNLVIVFSLGLTLGYFVIPYFSKY